MGVGWVADDLEKPSIIVESTFGDSHPASSHLFELVGKAVKGVTDGRGRHPVFLQRIFVIMLQILTKRKKDWKPKPNRYN